MNAVLWILLAAGGVPDVTAGPDLAGEAKAVEAPSTTSAGARPSASRCRRRR